MLKTFLHVTLFLLTTCLYSFSGHNSCWGLGLESYAFNTIPSVNLEERATLSLSNLNFNVADNLNSPKSDSNPKAIEKNELIPDYRKFWQLGIGYIVTKEDDGLDKLTYGLTLHRHGKNHWFQGYAISAELIITDSYWLNDVPIPLIDAMWLPGFRFIKKDYGAYIYSGIGFGIIGNIPIKVGIDFYVENLGLGISYKLLNPIREQISNDKADSWETLWFNLSYTS